MTILRPPAVAGLFYPDEAEKLSRQVARLVAEAGPAPGDAPRALVVPHAGYIYSGAVAARAYARIREHAAQYHRVLLLGPSHRVPVHGLALPDADAFCTPLGNIPLDGEAMTRLRDLPQICINDDAHALEHSLEVQLPFLQTLLGTFTLVPLAVGRATATEVAQVIEPFWNDPHTLVVISTDLSHFLDLETARALDQRTREAIEALRPEAIGHDQACGRIPLSGLLEVLRQHGRGIETLAMDSSATASGDSSRVVGYGSWVVQ
jgi:AmmeMemoRadiSam system protein B